jgi:Domain of unknown function (DUF5069)
MESLDLRTRPPRGPREKLDGLMMMPRTIDKIRATLPGGDLGPYHVGPGISSIMLRTVGVSVEDLTAVVARAAGEDEIAAWLREHADTTQYERANAIMSGLRDEDVPADHRARFESLYPERLRKQHSLNFDLIEADDRELYPDYAQEAHSGR